MRRTRSTSRKNCLEHCSGSVEASSVIVENEEMATPAKSSVIVIPDTLPRRSVRKSVISISDDSPLQALPESPKVSISLNETFSPEPDEIVFTKQELLDSIGRSAKKSNNGLSQTPVIHISLNQKENVAPKLVIALQETPISIGKRTSRFRDTPKLKKENSITKSSKLNGNIKSLTKKLIQTPEQAQRLVDVIETSTRTSEILQPIRSIRKRSKSLAADEYFEKKNVTFHSPANMEVSTFDIDLKMQTDKKQAAKRVRSFSETSKIDKTPQKSEKKKTPISRTKMPNFRDIIEKNFKKMESISDYQNRVILRGKSYVNGKTPIDKSKPQSTKIIVDEKKTENTKSNHSRIPVSTSKINNKLHAIISITADEKKRDNTNKLGKKVSKNLFDASSSKPLASLNKTDPVIQKLPTPLKSSYNNKNNSLYLYKKVDKPEKEDKVHDRRLKHMNLYKSRTNSTKKPENVTILKGVRTNRRFELQMKYRHMNEIDD